MRNQILVVLLVLFAVFAEAQEDSFQTCYVNLCENGELRLKEISSIDKIEVRSQETGEAYGIISFTIEFLQGNKKFECTGRGDALDARCKVFRDKLLVGDKMVIEDVVFKDIKGGGKIRTAPELSITVVKPPYLD